MILIDDQFPLLFKQKRVGKNNTYFYIYKFRTMKKDSPDIATHLLKDKNKYYTLTGPFLRRFSLDELPQLFNIIKGEMDFVGPRPALYNQIDLIKLRTQAKVHNLSPGITGWAQINGRDDLEISEKVNYDKYYLKHKSTSLNIKIIILTILKVLKSEGVAK